MTQFLHHMAVDSAGRLMSECPAGRLISEHSNAGMFSCMGQRSVYLSFSQLPHALCAYIHAWSVLTVIIEIDLLQMPSSLEAPTPLA